MVGDESVWSCRFTSGACGAGDWSLLVRVRIAEGVWSNMLILARLLQGLDIADGAKSAQKGPFSPEPVSVLNSKTPRGEFALSRRGAATSIA